jgi:hypothetical protein
MSNTAITYGGGLCIINIGVTLLGSTVNNNTATSGGGIYFKSEGLNANDTLVIFTSI